ncbi:MAG: DUF192 domain-containing protein [Nitrososphaerales archaeon]|nr:DUF192 domain-containing protein [Nitrososphaerales archaeon]
MSPKALISLAIVVSLSLAIGYYLFSAPGNARVSPLPSSFTANGKTFQITYLATTQSERQAGLMNRKITDTTTMLFIFPEPSNYPFWMYDTNSSLDIIWINATGTSGVVVYLVTGAQSCYLPVGCPNYYPTALANYVIEAKAGFARMNGINVGTTIRFG